MECAGFAAHDEVVELVRLGTCRVVRSLRSRSLPTMIGLLRASGPESELVVVERVNRSAATTDTDVAFLMRDAGALRANPSDNIVAVYGATIRKDHALVVFEYVEGETLDELFRHAAIAKVEIPLGVKLRIVTDTLRGLAAMHELRDGRGDLIGLVHGELMPSNVLVSLDGKARLLRACRLRASREKPSDASGYLAPELLLGDEGAGPAADVFGAGVLLWEVLNEARLFANVKPKTIVARLLSGNTPAPAIPADAPWARSLAVIVEKALSADPSGRFPSAQAMLSTIERAFDAHVASEEQVADLVRHVAGEAISRRRTELRSAVLAAVSRTSSHELVLDEGDFLADDDGRDSQEPSARTTIPFVPPAFLLRGEPREQRVTIPNESPPEPAPPSIDASALSVQPTTIDAPSATTGRAASSPDSEAAVSAVSGSVIMPSDPPASDAPASVSGPFLRGRGAALAALLAVGLFVVGTGIGVLLFVPRGRVASPVTAAGAGPTFATSNPPASSAARPNAPEAVVAAGEAPSARPSATTNDIDAGKAPATSPRKMKPTAKPKPTYDPQGI